VELLTPLHIKLAYFEGIHKALDVDGFLVQPKEKNDYDIWHFSIKSELKWQQENYQSII
jgi:hypothetical protein